MTAPAGPVRGLFRPRPWAGPGPSVARSVSVRDQHVPGPRHPRTH